MTLISECFSVQWEKKNYKLCFDFSLLRLYLLNLLLWNCLECFQV